MNYSDKSQYLCHVASVGFVNKTSLTVNTDKGSLLQLWKGGFLDMAPEWHERGVGAGTPVGLLTKLSNLPSVASLPTATSAWPDSLPDLKFKGYYTQQDQSVKFSYALGEAMAVDDVYSALNTLLGISRELKITSNTTLKSYYVLLISGSEVEASANNTFWIKDKNLMVILPENAVKASIMKGDGVQYLVVRLPDQEKTFSYKYSFLW